MSFIYTGAIHSVINRGRGCINFQCCLHRGENVSTVGNLEGGAYIVDEEKT